MNSLKRLKESLQKNNIWEIFSYIFFGGLTTVINLIVHFSCTEWIGMNYLLATCVSWFFSVLFAYETNRRWVFHSTLRSTKEWIVELCYFIFYRLLSLAIDVATMWLFISIFRLNALFAKLLTQIVVVLLNYLFSKFLIFKNNKK